MPWECRQPQATTGHETGKVGVLEKAGTPEAREVLNKLTQGPADDWLDTEFIRSAEAEADDSVTLGAVRLALAKIPGAMAADLHIERDDRI